MEDKQYQICLAEIELTDGDETWFHSFLVMADNCPDAEIKDRVFQQIEFDPDENNNLGVKFSGPLSEKCKPHTSFETIIRGNKDQIFPLWNRMQDLASQIAETGIPFGPNFRFEPTSINCRTGVRDTCRGVGLELCSKFTKHAAGLSAKALFPEEKLKPAAPQLHTKISP